MSLTATDYVSLGISDLILTNPFLLQRVRTDPTREKNSLLDVNDIDGIDRFDRLAAAVVDGASLRHKFQRKIIQLRQRRHRTVGSW